MNDELTDDKPEVMAAAGSHLKPITIRRKKFIHEDKQLYRVYSAPGEYKLVEADSAHSAYEVSGINRPHKIEREIFFRHIASREDLLLSDGETLELNSELPDPAEMKQLIFEALNDDMTVAASAFESVAISEWNRKAEAEIVAEPEPEAAAPTPAKAAAPAIEEPVRLSPEEVDKLLYQDE